MSELVATRDLQHYVIRRENGDYVTSLSFREVYGMAACRTGRARWRLKGSFTPYLSAYHLWPEVDGFGVGWGTIDGLTRRHPAGSDLVQAAKDEGPIRLTKLGDAVLDAILKLPGVAIEAGVAA